jgi:hypothetical protein
MCLLMSLLVITQSICHCHRFVYSQKGLSLDQVEVFSLFGWRDKKDSKIFKISIQEIL